MSRSKRRTVSLVPDVPIVLHSSHTEFKARANDEGFAFLQKRSPTFLLDFRDLLIEQCAFGDFVFQMPDGTEVARAADMQELEEQLHRVPAESIVVHSQHNHFSRWLTARTEFALAQKLRPRKVSDFDTLEHLRRDLIDSINDYRREQTEVSIGDFDAATFKTGDAFFLRIGSGSLGGKARGLAFMRHLLHKQRFSRRFPGVKISVPPAVVISTQVFDQFLDDNSLHEFAIHCPDDSEIRQRFLDAPLPEGLLSDLHAFLGEMEYPLAVRSSSLLEDSHYQPFTGVYETFMLGNQYTSVEERLERLARAIKLVYASTFSQHAKAYVRATPYRLEEEKMAVILQEVVGAAHGSRFYPDFSGVVRSHNFYPTAPMAASDGIAAVALGMGRAVVEGGRCLSFCPRYPRHPIQFSDVKDILSNSQSEFWAMNLEATSGSEAASSLREERFELDVAERDGTLAVLASTYSRDNDAVYDGVSRAGARIVSFAPILKHETFPLAVILDQLSKVGEAALGQPVEIEFAVRLSRSAGEASNFGFLQVRPLVLAGYGEHLRIENVDPAKLICKSASVLGNGRIQNLRDLVVVDFERFERARSQAVAEAVAHFNAKLMDHERPYLLVGVGRWGSNDPWLGIPIEWDEIAGARVIVEAGLRDMTVTPSQGSHFFQNLMAFQVGYFTVNPQAAQGLLDWEWLAAQEAVEEEECVRHIRLEQPAVVVMNGMTREGVIFKPGMETLPGS